jgi:glutathione S-transferase
MLQWQFFEQYNHEPFIAVARFIAKYLGLPANRKAEYKSKQKNGNKALKVMENS